MDITPEQIAAAAAEVENQAARPVNDVASSSSADLSSLLGAHSGLSDILLQQMNDPEFLTMLSSMLQGFGGGDAASSSASGDVASLDAFSLLTQALISDPHAIDALLETFNQPSAIDTEQQPIPVAEAAAPTKRKRGAPRKKKEAAPSTLSNSLPPLPPPSIMHSSPAPHDLSSIPDSSMLSSSSYSSSSSTPLPISQPTSIDESPSSSVSGSQSEPPKSNDIVDSSIHHSDGNIDLDMDRGEGSESSQLQQVQQSVPRKKPRKPKNSAKSVVRVSQADKATLAARACAAAAAYALRTAYEQRFGLPAEVEELLLDLQSSELGRREVASDRNKASLAQPPPPPPSSPPPTAPSPVSGTSAANSISLAVGGSNASDAVASSLAPSNSSLPSNVNSGDNVQVPAPIGIHLPQPISPISSSSFMVSAAIASDSAISGPNPSSSAPSSSAPSSSAPQSNTNENMSSAAQLPKKFKKNVTKALADQADDMLQSAVSSLESFQTAASQQPIYSEFDVSTLFSMYHLPIPTAFEAWAMQYRPANEGSNPPAPEPLDVVVAAWQKLSEENKEPFYETELDSIHQHLSSVFEVNFAETAVPVPNADKSTWTVAPSAFSLWLRQQYREVYAIKRKSATQLSGVDFFEVWTSLEPEERMLWMEEELLQRYEFLVSRHLGRGELGPMNVMNLSQELAHSLAKKQSIIYFASASSLSGSGFSSDTGGESSASEDDGYASAASSGSSGQAKKRQRQYGRRGSVRRSKSVEPDPEITAASFYSISSEVQRQIKRSSRPFTNRRKKSASSLLSAKSFLTAIPLLHDAPSHISNQPAVVVVSSAPASRTPARRDLAQAASSFTSLSSAPASASSSSSAAVTSSQALALSAPSQMVSMQHLASIVPSPSIAPLPAYSDVDFDSMTIPL